MSKNEFKEEDFKLGDVITKEDGSQVIVICESSIFGVEYKDLKTGDVTSRVFMPDVTVTDIIKVERPCQYKTIYKRENKKIQLIELLDILARDQKPPKYIKYCGIEYELVNENYDGVIIPSYYVEKGSNAFLEDFLTRDVLTEYVEIEEDYL